MALKEIPEAIFMYGNETFRCPKFIQELYGWTPKTRLIMKYSDVQHKLIIEEEEEK